MDDGLDAGRPFRGELVLLSVEVVFADVLAGADFAFGSGRTFGEAGVSAVGGALLFGDAEESHGGGYPLVLPEEAVSREARPGVGNGEVSRR